MIARTFAYLIEEGEVFIDLSDVILFWEGVADALVEFAMVGIVVEQHSIGFPAIASGTASLLEIGFEGVWTVDVDDQSHIGLVDTHAECICGYHHTYLVFLPVALSLILDSCIEASVVEGSADT